MAKQFAKTTSNSGASVVIWIKLTPIFVNGYDDSFFPRFRKCTRIKNIIKYLPYTLYVYIEMEMQFLSSHFLTYGEH